MGTACIIGLFAGGAGTAWATGPTGAVHPKVLPVMPVTAQNLQHGQANNSPEIVADPKDPKFVALASRIDGPTFSCALQVSVDGGRIWAPARPVPVLPAGAQRCYAPQIAFDATGRLYYLFAGLAGRGNAPMGVFLTTSSDYGHSFTKLLRVLGGQNYMTSMAIDATMGSHGRLHLVWVHSSTTAPLGGFTPSDNPILASYSDDGGKTFSTPVRVSDPTRQRVVAPVMVLGPNHSVDVVYYDLGNDARDYQGLAGPTWTGTWSLVSSHSSDGGKSFGAGTVVDSQVVPPDRVMLIYTMPPPALAIDHQGRLFVAWTDARHGSADILFRRSTDTRRTWTSPLRLNDDPVGDGATQYLPQLSVSPNGRIDAVFLDRRNDP
ncbi:MAG: sialidase family protein, partial [Acidimicrobiales bacterium]